MSILKCKMCGGELVNIDNESHIAECIFCGVKQTIPKPSDENIESLFNRANTLRKMCEFDKAEKIYEKILESNEEEAEAYWGLILCKFGIEYIEDPKTLIRIATCNRTSYDAIAADINYKNAIKYANYSQRILYEEEAKRIDEIQKEILTLVKEEKPYDIFICYKESDNLGKRTIDSVLANKIYHQLKEDGYKVFFSAITLADKLGSAYEPYIFAALNSAKVMLVVGTKPEYFNATWVKNEWHRYLKLMKNDKKKTLIPCYQNMDAYELPEEFSHLQALNMGEIGFISDIEKAIRRLIGEKNNRKQDNNIKSNANVENLIKRMYLFLEDGDFENAVEYAEKILDIDAECAEAYMGCLMAELEIKNKAEFQSLDVNFSNNLNYRKAMRFGSEELKKELLNFNQSILKKELESKYNEAVILQNNNEYNLATEIFKSLGDYKDSIERLNYLTDIEYVLAQKKEEKRQIGYSIKKKKSQLDVWVKKRNLYKEMKGYRMAFVIFLPLGILLFVLASFVSELEGDNASVFPFFAALGFASVIAGITLLFLYIGIASDIKKSVPNLPPYGQLDYFDRQINLYRNTISNKLMHYKSIKEEIELIENQKL